MATLQSAGLHEPTGLQYLVSEGLLSETADASQYQWTQQPLIDIEGLISIQEVLRVDRCVVWSRNGSIKRVFNLDIEGESILHAFATTFVSISDIEAGPENGTLDSRDGRDAALVVVLKSQAHIFCLSGAMHVIPLAFEVARALPFSYGCILQPGQSHPQDVAGAASGLSTSHWQQASITTSQASFLFEGYRDDRSDNHQKIARLPTYCITDLLADIGLVAANYTRTPKRPNEMALLPSDEELIFISSDGHLHEQHFHDCCLAVTINRSSSSFTIWQVNGIDEQLMPSRTKANGVGHRKRQSSNIHERPRVTSGRAVDPAREGPGGIMQSFVEHEPKPQSSQLSHIEDLAAELGQDFEPTGVQTRSARRISSMLARTDLAPATDRSAFNEAVGASRKSLSRTVRREGSIASFMERQSFGGRKSFPTATSFYSTATSFLDPGSRVSLGHAPNEAIDELELEVTNGRLEKAVAFTKLKSFDCHKSSSNCPPDKLNVLLIPHPLSISPGSPAKAQVSVCVHEAQSQLMTVVTIAVDTGANGDSSQRKEIGKPKLKAVQIQKGTNIKDACYVVDGSVSRLLVLSKTSQGDDVLHLEAPWSSSFRLDLPAHYLVHSPDTDTSNQTSFSKHDIGRHRTFSADQIRISRFLSTFNVSRCSFADTHGRFHVLQVTMQPRRRFDKAILRVSKYVLPTQLQDSLLVASWEVARWLEAQCSQDEPGTAIAITLFTMAVPFISSLQSKPATPSKHRKTRMSSGPLIDNTALLQMEALEQSRGSPSWMQSPAWAWMSRTEEQVLLPTATAKRHSQLELSDTSSLSSWLVRCTDLTRDFLQSPEGENMTGPEGYLPTAINQDRAVRRTALASITVALYLMLEELKIQPLSVESEVNDKVMLLALITRLASWLNWQTWTASMQTQLKTYTPSIEKLVLDKATIDSLDAPPEQFAPISILEHVDNTLQSRATRYYTLVDLVHSAGALAADHPLIKEAQKSLPLSATVLLSTQSQQGQSPKSLALAPSDLLPDVVAKACALRLSYSTAPETLVPIIPRGHAISKPLVQDSVRTASHIATRDIRVMCGQALDAESLGRWDATSETDRQAVTRLIFSHDRRFQEATKLVNQSRPPEVEYDPQPNWTEADALEAQKLLAQYATRRTFAVVTGRGLMHFNARMPLLTEMVPRAQFSMQCVLRSRSDTEGGQSMTFSADRAQFTEDKVSWAFFHNGAAAGLSISKAANFIDTSWILYNKPPELTNRHAGFLLALGLNGHLKTLAKWVAFKYLTPKHTMTSVGLLLGLAASYKGTADTLITRLLSVHVTCLLPPGAAELNLSPLTQMTGLIGIGLLYHGSQHRRMSEVMISEIESQEPEERAGDEPILRDEGYRLAAGMALGLINLGYGLSLHVLHDMRVVERLLSIAVGTKNVNLVHVLDRATAGAVIAIAFIFMKTEDTSVARKVDIPDTQHQFDYVRPDVFLLRTLARHLIMWNNMRPELSFFAESLPRQYGHRADLKNVKRLVTNDLPFFHVIAGMCFALALKYAGSQNVDARDMLISYLDQFSRLSRMSAMNYDAKVTLNGIRNCLDILALSCATVMAGSGDVEVYRRLRALHGRTDKDIPYGSHLAAHMAIGALFLSGGTATFGTSNLAVAALVMSLYPLFPTDVLDNRGHLQALRHLWVLAAEHRCLSLRDGEHGQILGDISVSIKKRDGTTLVLRTPGLLPELDQIKSISIEAEGFWPVYQDLDAMIGGDCPSPSPPKTVREVFETSSSGVSITLQRRISYDRPNIDPLRAQLQALNNGKTVPDATNMAAKPSTTLNGPAIHSDHSPTNWIFNLKTFGVLDHAERELTLATLPVALDSTYASLYNSKNAMLATTSVDTRLELELGTLGPEDLDEILRQPVKPDKVWQIRLLLSWADQFEKQNVERQRPQNESDTGHNRAGKPWLRDKVIERLRWRAWTLSGGE